MEKEGGGSRRPLNQKGGKDEGGDRAAARVQAGPWLESLDSFWLYPPATSSFLQAARVGKSE